MKEIERKYLVAVRDCALPQPDDLITIEQGYIISNSFMEWRVRHIVPIKKSKEIEQTLGYFPYTTSFKFGNGFVRREYEWSISETLYKVLSKLVPQWVKKSRATYGTWILDKFYRDLYPLHVAEREAPVSGWQVEMPMNGKSILGKPKLVSKDPVPKGISIVRDVTEEGTYAVKRLARMTPAEQKELIIDEVADLGIGSVDAECSIYSSEQSQEQRLTAIPCGSCDFQ